MKPGRPRAARLLPVAGGCDRMWPTCQAATAKVPSRATVVTMAVIVIPSPQTAGAGGPAAAARAAHPGGWSRGIV